MKLKSNVLKSIVNDTLKVDGKWSRTSLTMFTAWIVVLGMACIDFVWNGLRYDVWATLTAVATGIKIADAYTKKITK
jgi:hypothetical protein